MNNTGKHFTPFKTMPTFKHIMYRDRMEEPKYPPIDKHVNDVISTSSKNFDPYFSSRQMIENQLQSEERNDITFYKIKEIDKVRAKKRDNTDFRSIHYITDKPIAASQKLQLYQYKDVLLQRPEEREPLNEFQLKSRQHLKQKDPEKKLLLNEIYAKLGEEGTISKHEEHIQKQKESLKQIYEPRMKMNYVFKSQQQFEKNKLQQLEQFEEEQLRSDLDSWSTQHTQHYKNNKKQKQIYQRPARQSQSVQLNNTISKVKKSIVGILSRKNTETINEHQSFMQSEDSKKNSISLPGLADALKENKQKEKQEFEKLKKQYEKKKGINQNQKNTENKSKATFNDALQSAISLMQKRKGDDIGGNLDRDVKKKLASYMNSIPDGENENPNNVKIDLDSRKIKKSLLARLELESQHTTIRNLARFYEKQTVIIFQQLELKIREVDSYISNKTNSIRILRTENHQLQIKLRKIENRMFELKGDLKEGPGKKQKQNATPQVRQSTQSKINMRESQVVASTVSSDNRQLLIDQFMTNNNYESSIEDQIEEQRKQRQQAEDKIQSNLEQIFQQEETLQQSRKKQKDLEKSLKIFFFELLKIGKDCRQDGISWIVIHLWCQGEKINLSHLPDFLDQKAKEFIIVKSQKQMELQELMSIQDLQMDVYKQNIHNQIEAQQQNQKQQKSTFDRTPFSTNGFNNISILDQQAAIMQEQQQQNNNNQNTNSINSIIGQSKMQVTQNLSVINVSQVKQKQSEEIKKDKVQNYESMLQGLTQQEIDVIDCTIDQLTSPKITSNNIFYNETIKKMRENFRVQKTIVPPKQNVKVDENISEYDDSFDEGSEIIMEEDEEIKPEPMKHNIVLFENENQMNKYETKQEFFKEQRNLTQKIAAKNKELHIIQEQELSRIIKEFDYKNYIVKYKTKYSTVLCSLFGAFKAEREIVRNGLKENNDKQKPILED